MTVDHQNNPSSNCSKIIKSAILTVTLLIPNAIAQSLADIKTPETPLVLKEQGSFYIGGESVKQTANEVAGERDFPADEVTINQMYVEYMIPQEAKKVPVVMIHGATLSGKTYDTTPDGRMGWFEYFVRQDHPVYVPDQVGRARSGFNQAIYNEVRAGNIPPEQQPGMFRLGDNFGSWTNFRFGLEPGVAYPDTQFPVEAAAELSKQDIPDLNDALPELIPTWEHLASLSEELGGTVLIGHSQSGLFPLHAALMNPDAVKGIVAIEPGGTCHEDFGARELGDTTPEQLKTLAGIPTLFIFGDYLEDAPSWNDVFEDCKVLVDEINAAGGNATMWNTEALGRGNSHMLMQDKNSLEIADMIMAWIEENVEKN